MESVLNSLEKQSDSITNFNNNQGEENKTMEIYVNSEKVDFTLEAEKTAGDIIKAFEADCAKNAAAITAVRIDDDVLCEENTDSLYGRALDKIQKMEIETLCAQDIIYNLKELAVKFETLCGELEQISFFQSGKDSKVSAILTSFADLFDMLCRIIALSALFPEYFQEFKIEDRAPLEFLKDFSPILADFEKSLADADTVLTGDLAEYEIAPVCIRLYRRYKRLEIPYADFTSGRNIRDTSKFGNGFICRPDYCNDYTDFCY